MVRCLRREHRWGQLALVIVLACVVRGGWLGWKLAALHADPDSYRQLAVNLLATGTYGYFTPDQPAGAAPRPTAFRPPLYPLLLAAVGAWDHVGPASVAGLHFVLGVLTVTLAWFLGRQWGLGNWSLLAAGLTACDPILLHHSSLVMTETAATLFAVLSLLLLTRFHTRATATRGWLAGAAIGCAILCRPTFLPWFGLVLVVIAAGSVLRMSHRRWAWLALAAGGAIVLVPWVARNVVVFQRPMATTTHGGYTLLLGNNEAYYAFLAEEPLGNVWRSAELDAQVNEVKRQLRYDEVAADRWAYEQATHCIRRHPARFVYANVIRVANLWGLVPHRLTPDESWSATLERQAVGAWYLVLFSLAAIGVGVLRRELLRPPWLWGLLLCLTFTAIHFLYWSNMRMRAPLMPAVCLVAAAGVRGLSRQPARPPSPQPVP